MVELNINVVFVKGALRGAIYNLQTGDVYSINETAVEIIDRYVKTGERHEFLYNLNGEGLLAFDFQPSMYKPSKVEVKPNTVWYELTQKCNMRCLHCYEGNEHRQGDCRLSIEEWYNITRQLKKADVGRIILIGGEPTLFDQIKNLILFLHDEKIATTLFTNTYAINNDLMDVIFKAKPEVKVSLYGVTADVHDSITGVIGSFNKLIATIKDLGDAGIEVNVAVTVMKENEHHQDLFSDFLSKLPIHRYKLDMIRKVKNGAQDDHIPTSTNLRKSWYRVKPNFYANKEIFDRNIRYNSCWYGKMVVTENGLVLPCVFARNHVVGNIRENTVQEILSKGSALHNLWCESVSKINQCAFCEYRYACVDCRPLAESYCDMESKNPRCLYNPPKGEWDDVP